MRLKTLENQRRVYMNPHDYDTMLSCAPSRRARLAMRLMGECSCRVSEVAQEIYAEDLRQSTDPEVDLWFLPIHGKDTKSRNTDGKRRDVWVPQSVKDAIDEYRRVENLAADVPLFPFSKKTVQNDVKDAAANAAEKTGNDDFEYISAHDFRAYFATNMLLREGVDIEIVMELGGWENRETMDPYLNASFDDVIQHELAVAGVLEQDTDTALTEYEQLRREIERLREAVEAIDPEVSVDRPEEQRGLTDFADS